MLVYQICHIFCNSIHTTDGDEKVEETTLKWTLNVVKHRLFDKKWKSTDVRVNMIKWILTHGDHIKRISLYKINLLISNNEHLLKHNYKYDQVFELADLHWFSS
jgi:hypothetical protein